MAGTRSPGDARERAIFEALAELRAELVAELPARIDALEEALNRWLTTPSELAARQRATQLAHQLFGSAGTHGCTETGEAAGALESCLMRLGRDVDPSEGERQELTRLFARVREAACRESSGAR